MQGLNTTPVHAHGAFFGVYGMLGLGLTLVCLRALTVHRVWRERLLAFGFWAMNIGLMAQIVLSVLPVGLLQTCGRRWSTATGTPAAPAFWAPAGCRRCAGSGSPVTPSSRSARSP